MKISKEKGGKFPNRILDLGTGSGCLLLSLLQEFPNGRNSYFDLILKATGVGVDMIEGALGVALYNSRDLVLDQRVTWKRR